MTKFFVKRPYLVLVAVIIILTIGGVSLSKMQTDLMPEFELPVMAVIATEPGASPEKVENDVTKVLESSLGTVSGVDTVSSTSSNNYSIIMLTFADDTDMDSAMVRVSQALDLVELPEGCGRPNLIEISMDMMATMYAGVNYEGKDIKDLSTFASEVVQPFVERQEGVASVSTSGLVENTLEIRLDKKKIDKINNKILSKTNSKLSDAEEEIKNAEDKIADSKEEIKNQQDKLNKQQSDTNQQLAESVVQLSNAQATKAAYEATLSTLQASKTALEAEKKAYDDAKIEDTYDTIDEMFAGMSSQYGQAAQLMKVEIPTSLEDAVSDKKRLNKFLELAKQMGYEEEIKDVSYDSLKKIYDIVNVRIPQIDTELANLEIEIKAAQAVVDTITKQMGNLDGTQSEVYAGGYNAAAGFGSGQAQLSAALSQLEASQEELASAKKQLEDSRQAAIDNSNIDTLLSLDTLSGLIYAQNFSMPAGYIDDKNDVQWLVDVGDTYDDKEQIENMVLTKISGIGKIKISDVAEVTMVDNAGQSYAKINGQEALLLSIFKSSTYGTNEVSNNLTDAFKKIEDKYDGLSITPMMNQGDYIEDIIDSVLSSILLGAMLAIIVLAVFLKDVKPTILVAFSIPFSVMFAIIIMYFTGITINVMSLGGLSISIGMLVDNSIVVMENIYRLRNHGISAARAAVQGTRQMMAPIIASTITTICVFLPMVYTTGTIADLLMPFAFTISYALIASLIIAVTVVPTIGSVVLKQVKVKKHKWFDKITEVYSKALDFCLRVKIVPLGIAILLFILSVARTFSTGLVLLDDMESDQISASLTLAEDVDMDTAYETADKMTEAIMKVDGIDKVGVMDGNATASSSALGTSSSSDNHSSFSFIILTKPEIKTTKQFENIRKEIEKNAEDIECEEFSVTSSALGAMSSLMGQGITINIYGEDKDELMKISQDVAGMLEKTKGCENVSDGLSEDTKQLHLKMDKDKIAANGLTVAQIYQELASRLTTEKTAISLNYEGTNIDVNIVDETKVLTYENILNMQISATTMNEEGQQVTKKYKLSRFATLEEGFAVDSISRENQSPYMTVSAEVGESYNPTLIARDVQKDIDKYDVPDGYTIEIAGNTEQVLDMLYQMLQAIALGFLLVYLVMVAQFQSLLSPFIIIFTVPLAFTGGMIGLMIFGSSISALALMGFMILMGTVVNNGIVFVDYVNQLRMKGVEKRTALLATGKTRLRPILMTAMTTILSMSVMVFSQDASNAMQKSMSIVVCFGLIYSTFMTLFIVPVMYDILYRRQPKEIDVGDENLDDIPDETSELLNADNA